MVSTLLEIRIKPNKMKSLVYSNKQRKFIGSGIYNRYGLKVIEDAIKKPNH